MRLFALPISGIFYKQLPCSEVRMFALSCLFHTNLLGRTKWRRWTDRLQKIMTFIHAHYGERISIDDMARAAAISRTEVFRCFQTVLRKKPIEYLTEYRLSIATILLASTDRTLSDISISCGFNSASYFGKVFREHHGISPKKYRDQLREK